jgi:hypothetical protein
MRDTLHARIQPGLPGKGRKYLRYVVDEQINAARLHLTALYDHGLAVGPRFTAVESGSPHPKYAFWLEGIRRHIQQCESSLGSASGGGGQAAG